MTFWVQEAWSFLGVWSQTAGWHDTVMVPWTQLPVPQLPGHLSDSKEPWVMCCLLSGHRIKTALVWKWGALAWLRVPLPDGRPHGHISSTISGQKMRSLQHLTDGPLKAWSQRASEKRHYKRQRPEDSTLYSQPSNPHLSGISANPSSNTGGAILPKDSGRVMRGRKQQSSCGPLAHAVPAKASAWCCCSWTPPPLPSELPRSPVSLHCCGLPLCTPRFFNFVLYCRFSPFFICALALFTCNKRHLWVAAQCIPSFHCIFVKISVCYVYLTTDGWSENERSSPLRRWEDGQPEGWRWEYGQPEGWRLEDSQSEGWTCLHTERVGPLRHTLQPTQAGPDWCQDHPRLYLGRNGVVS